MVIMVHDPQSGDSRTPAERAVNKGRSGFELRDLRVDVPQSI